MHSLLFVLLVVSAHSLTLPSIFASHAVFPANKEVIFWGLTEYDTVNVTVRSSGLSYELQTFSDLDGLFTVVIPSIKPSFDVFRITVFDGVDTMVLDDILFGMVYFCSGQSNMQLSVDATENATQEIQDAFRIGQLGVRILQVALNDNFCNASKPALNFTAQIPWSVANTSNIGEMSAVCYYFGKQQILTRPGIPIGLIASSWGGTAIEPWMSPDGLGACSNQEDMELQDFTDISQQKRNYMGNPDPGSLVNVGCTPTLPSSLYYSMVYPFLQFPIDGILWYQGESNVGNAQKYSRCFPAMVSQWRFDWYKRSKSTDIFLPFLFVQLSSWPAGDTGGIADLRYAQTLAMSTPSIGMAVAADIGDPSGIVHPIHPPFKQELARRLFLSARNIIFGEKIPAGGPVIISYEIDLWNNSWGNFHYGTGGYVNHCTVFQCFGIRLSFDQGIVIAPNSGRQSGLATGFEVVSKTGNVQLVTFSGHWNNKNTTIQLNGTSVFGSLVELRYAWHDYPQMNLYNTFGQPVAPFNITINVP